MRKTTALVPWFGSNRTLAANVGRLRGCTHVTVPFGGSLCELQYIEAHSILVSDLHRHVVNLARVVQDDGLRGRLVEMLDQTAYHPDELRAAQDRCRTRESEPVGARPDAYWAYDYFVASWMSRNGSAGTDREFEATYSVRYRDGGGDSAVRFRSATEALKGWGAVMRRCTFVCEDVFGLLARVHDDPKHGVYCDPPFPDAGSRYRHSFTAEQQRQLAARLAAFDRSPILLRYYEHPLIEDLYPASTWTWERFTAGRRQTNESGPEVLLSRRCRIPDAAVK